MPVDLTALNASITALTTEVANTETLDTSVEALLAGQAAAITKAVTDALTADAAANATSIQAATAAISTVTGRFQAASTTLGAAVVAGTPGAPPVNTPPPTGS